MELCFFFLFLRQCFRPHARLVPASMTSDFPLFFQGRKFLPGMGGPPRVEGQAPVFPPSFFFGLGGRLTMEGPCHLHVGAHRTNCGGSRVEGRGPWGVENLRVR